MAGIGKNWLPTRNWPGRGTLAEMAKLPEITSPQLKARLDQGDSLLLLDVREPDEISISHLDGILAIPIGEVTARMAEVPRDREIVVICRAGGRSAQVAEILLAHGYEQVWNLSGGMKSWSAQVDPSMPVA